MLLEFQKHIEKNHLDFKNKNILVAVSGGIDSVVLCDLLNKSKVGFSIAHCNFCLRGKASFEDELFVKELAKSYQSPYHSKQFSTIEFAQKQGISIQMAARDLRYEWFEELIKSYNFDFLLTAHHADDNLETFLINLIRGTGLDGLIGIPQINGKIVRPLLSFSREEIVNHAKENQLNWREDQSNAETKYVRNKLRHDIIPIFKKINPNLLNTFSQTIENLQGSSSIIQDRLQEVESNVKQIDDKGFIKYNIAKLKELSDEKAYLYELFKSYGFTEWNDLNDLLFAQSGKQIYSKTHCLLKDRDFLILKNLEPLEEELSEFTLQEDSKELQLNNFILKLKTIDSFEDEEIDEMELQSSRSKIFIDKRKLSFPLLVRKWQIGDYFYPFGMKGRKKLSKYFKDEKVSIFEKKNIWLLCSGKEIVWIINYRFDDRFKIDKNTKDILIIEALE